MNTTNRIILITLGMLTLVALITTAAEYSECLWLVGLVAAIGWLILLGSKPESPAGRTPNRLPNGLRRHDYHDYGISDDEIELWGLDQPGAPPPEAAGWVFWDMMDEMDEW